jgi:hypothetical protein
VAEEDLATDPEAAAGIEEILKAEETDAAKIAVNNYYKCSKRDIASIFKGLFEQLIIKSD